MTNRLGEISTDHLIQMIEVLSNITPKNDASLREIDHMVSETLWPHLHSPVRPDKNYRYARNPNGEGWVLAEGEPILPNAVRLAPPEPFTTSPTASVGLLKRLVGPCAIGTISTFGDGTHSVVVTAVSHRYGHQTNAIRADYHEGLARLTAALTLIYAVIVGE